MKKLMLLATMLAVVLLVAAPALAQNAPQTSGAASSNLTVDAAGAGNVCAQQANNVNTGNNQQNLANAQANIQANINLLERARQDIAAGGDVNVASGNAATQTNTATSAQYGITQLNAARQQCEQALAIVQGAAGKAEATAGKAEAKAEAGKAGEAKAGGAEAKAEAPKAEAKAGGAGGGAMAMLPATGGISLLVLVAGALLAAGGLVVRRIWR